MERARESDIQPVEISHRDSEAKRLLQAFDWARTPLGPMDAWPRSLLSLVDMVMELPSPAIIFWGPEQTQIYNDGYAVIMGPRHPAYFGASYRESWPDTYPLIYPWMRRVLDQGDVVEVRQAHIPVTRYGFEEEAYFTFTFSPLRDDEGRIAGLLQPVFEVTATVLSERRAETLRMLTPSGSLEPVADAIAALSRNPRDVPFALVYLWNAERECLLLAGETEGAGAGSDPDRRAQLDAAARRVVERNGQEWVGEQADAARSGADPYVLLLPMEGVAGAAPLGVIAFGLSPRLHFDKRYRAFLESVTAQLASALQRASLLQARERQRQHLSDLFLQVPAGIAVLQGPDHVFELVNPVYQALIGPRDLIGRPLREALPEMRDQPFPRILDEVYRSGQAHVGQEEPTLLRRGDERSGLEEVFFNYVYQPLRDAQSGHISGILVFAYEVTEQVRARQRAEALAGELRGEHERKDDFLAMLAHELRNPLAPISTAAEVLSLGRLPQAQVKRTSEIITRQVRHMTALVNDLLDVSRVTRGLVNIDRQPQDLKSVAAHAVEQVRPLVEARRHHLAVEQPAGDAWVLGDQKRLVQIFTNLLGNAAKYTPSGGEIALVLHVEGDEVVITVRDNGIGMPAALQPKVFGLFVQAERSTDRAQGGLGVGLALVKSLVDLHGGTVACYSSGAGQGSEFTVRLPLLRVQADAPAGGAQALPAAAAVARRILVVDDNQDAARMLALYLGEAGHHVAVEHASDAALERVLQEPFDVFLLDVGLPGMDGCELARRLRARPQTAQALVVAVTGYGQEADRQRALDAGFDDYLVKPPDPERLTALLAAPPR
ncbi:ATP-binding protein [Azohydromonas lata]|uniref:histidine kinase n=1 Tax=Azohydromonas lata TaxID=45677 RepID=A0ABU5INH8_9BURK|nr:ATP-binding protein [Azohydromonas lata]MDZ5460452.1 ATP-binding protein [Azohydromonas lata]